MRRFFQILAEHKWAVILAVLVGLIIAFPEIYFRYAHQDIYQGIGLGAPDDLFYLARIQEVRDGHFSIASAFELEGKDLPYLQPPLSEIIAAFLGKLFGLGLISSVYLGNFIFPFLNFLLVYLLVLRLSRKKIVALMASITVLLSTNLLEPRAFYNSLFHQQVIDYGFLPFSRLISPQVHLLFFFSFLWLFLIFLEKKKWVYGIISGIILGLSFYTYFYTWTFIFAFLGCLVLIFIWQKKWFWVKNIILTALIGLVVAIPYFWNLWQELNHPLYSEISLRFGLVKTHAPQLGATILVLLALFLFFFPRGWQERYYFSLGLVLTPLVVLNQQLITGQVMVPDHYHWYFHRPLFIILLLIIIFWQIEQKVKKPSLRKVIYSALVGLILTINLYNAALAQVSSYQARQKMTLARQTYGVVFKWFNENSQKDEVVMADSYVSDLIPIYTHLNPLAALGGPLYSLISTEKLLEKMFLQYRFNGLKAEQAREKFLADRRSISGNIYGEYYRKQMGDREAIPDKKLYLLAEEYKKFLAIPLEDILRQGQTRYLIWDRINYPNWSISQYPFLKLVYQTEGINVYKITDSNL